MNNEVFLLLSIFALGNIVLLRFFKLDGIVTFFLSFLIGLIFFFFAGLFYIVGKYALFVGATFLLFLWYLYVKSNQNGFAKNVGKYWVLHCGLFAIVLYVISRNITHVGITWDSIQQLKIAQNIETETSRKFFSSWGPLFIVINAFAKYINLPFLSIINSAASLSFYGTLGFLIFSILLLKKCKRTVALTVAASVLLMFFSTPFFNYFSFYYLHNNLFSAVFFNLFLGFFLIFSLGNRQEYLILSAVFLVGFSFSRVEAPLIAAISSLFVLLTDQNNKTLRNIYGLLIPLLNISWAIFLYISIGGGSDILSSSNLIIMTIFHLVPIAYILGRVGERRILKCVALNGFVFLPWAALAGYYFLKRDHLLVSLNSLYSNLTKTGGWGYSFQYCIPMFLFVYLIIKTRKNRPESLFFELVINYIILIVLFSYFRIPFRITWGDSANRIFLAIFPAIVLLISTTDPLKNEISSLNSAN